MKGSTARFAHVDALRGIAALAVLVQHIVHPIIDRAQLPLVEIRTLQFFVYDGFQLGLFGVDLFFLISGFVIPFSLKGHGAAKRFIVSRFLRLYPAFWLTLTASLLILTWSGTSLSAKVVLANATMVPKLLGVEAVNGVYWTLLIEMIFYAICFLLYVAGLLHRPLAIAGFAIVLASAPTLATIANHVFGTHLPSIFLAFHLSFLFLGTLIRYAFHERNKGAQCLLAVTFIVLLACLPAVTGVALTGQNGLSESAPVGSLVASIAAVVVFCISLRMRRPTNGWLVHTGEISYSIYLFHAPIALIAFGWIAAGLPGAVGFVSWTVAATLIVSELVYKFVELPSIALGKRINHQIYTTLAAEIAP